MSVRAMPRAARSVGFTGRLRGRPGIVAGVVVIALVAHARRRSRSRFRPDRPGRQHRRDPVADVRDRPGSDLDPGDRDDRVGPAAAAGAHGDARRSRAGRRRCHVPGTDPEPAGRPVRAGHRIGRGARGGHRGRPADPHRRGRVRPAPRAGLRGRPADGVRGGPPRRWRVRRADPPPADRLCRRVDPRGAAHDGDVHVRPEPARDLLVPARRPRRIVVDPARGRDADRRRRMPGHRFARTRPRWAAPRRHGRRPPRHRRPQGTRHPARAWPRWQRRRRSPSAG